MSDKNLKVVSYHDTISGYGPYWKIVDATDQTIGQMISGCMYPADGFKTRKSAQTLADRLMSKAKSIEDEERLANNEDIQQAREYLKNIGYQEVSEPKVTEVVFKHPCGYKVIIYTNRNYIRHISGGHTGSAAMHPSYPKIILITYIKNDKKFSLRTFKDIEKPHVGVKAKSIGVNEQALNELSIADRLAYMAKTGIQNVANRALAAGGSTKAMGKLDLSAGTARLYKDWRKYVGRQEAAGNTTIEDRPTVEDLSNFLRITYNLGLSPEALARVISKAPSNNTFDPRTLFPKLANWLIDNGIMSIERHGETTPNTTRNDTAERRQKPISRELIAVDAIKFKKWLESFGLTAQEMNTIKKNEPKMLASRLSHPVVAKTIPAIIYALSNSWSSRVDPTKNIVASGNTIDMGILLHNLEKYFDDKMKIVDDITRHSKGDKDEAVKAILHAMSSSHKIALIYCEVAHAVAQSIVEA